MWLLPPHSCVHPGLSPKVIRVPLCDPEAPGRQDRKDGGRTGTGLGSGHTKRRGPTLYPLLASVFPSPTPAHTLNSLGSLWSHVFWHSAKDR